GQMEARLAHRSRSQVRPEKSCQEVSVKKKTKEVTAEATGEHSRKESASELPKSPSLATAVLDPKIRKSASPASSIASLSALAGAVKQPMPSSIHPMLATPVGEPFDGEEWLFEIKWDGYRAVAFIEDGKARLVSRNQNDLTARYPELKNLSELVKAKNAILDGEVVALDEQGRASFSLMQQRTGFRPGGRRAVEHSDVPVFYYAFDLLYLDGYDLRRVPLEERKRRLASLLVTGDSLRYSDHSSEQGKARFEIARQKGLGGILAEKRDRRYQERRSLEW